MISLFQSDDERKRDRYFKLYNTLKKETVAYKNLLNKINAGLNSYKNSVPRAESNCIPSNDFQPKRDELDNRLAKYISEASQKVHELNSAKQAAYDRYLYYKSKVIANEGK